MPGWRDWGWAVMTRLRVLVLGAGFGGLEVASRLSAAAHDEVEVTVIDQSDSFYFGFSKLDVMFGRVSAGEVRHYYKDLHKRAVEFRQERIVGIDPDHKRVTTDVGSHVADVLVIALGADYDIAASPGLTSGGHEFYSMEGAERLAAVLPTFEIGHAVIGVLGTPYKCPPAPAETALLLDDYLRRRGCRGATDITLVSPLPVPVPPSPATSEALLATFAQRGIRYVGGQTVTHCDLATRSIATAEGEQIECDLFLGIPLHRAPQVLVDAGLTKDGWVDVDPYTLATSYPDVYAVGDCNNAPVPRAGVFAERAADVVADQILAKLHGGDVSPYDGYGMCYIEFGGGEVARVEITFITLNGVQGGPFVPPSLEMAREKDEFGTSRIARWFGS